MVEEGEDLEVRRKRLRFRSWHRGTREMDLLLGGFADRNLPVYSAHQLALFEQVLQYSDPDLYDWLTGKEVPPAALEHNVMKQLRNFAQGLERS